MAKPHKPETAPPRAAPANRPEPVAAEGGPAAAFPSSVSGRASARRANPHLPLAPASHPSAVPTRAAPAGAIVSRRAADRLRSGHLWVYASDVSPPCSKTGRTLDAGGRQRGIFLGTALYSPASQIALRLVSREALDHAAWLELLASRLRAAIARRKPLLDAANDACRLCFSEADELPGLIVDKYGDLVVVQRLTKGLLAAGVGEMRARFARGTRARGHFRAARSAHSRT